MPKKNWTADQEAAIYTKYTADGKSCNILVNAAAGSGKTAVLVERIIEKLIPGENNPYPVDVNRLLVVTFTNAAAAEMKERISDALEKKAAEAEETGDTVLCDVLKHQMKLVYEADITTIDAFCLKVIRENFHLLGIDPNFGIADNAQLALMADEAMEELFEECYENADSDFLQFADMFSDGRDNSNCAAIIHAVYTFIMAMPSPMQWLEEKTEMFLLKDGVEKSPWIEKTLKKKNALCSEAVRTLEKGLEFVFDNSPITYSNVEEALKIYPAGENNEVQHEWVGYYEILAYEYNAAKAALKSDWDTSCAIFNSLEFATWKKTGAYQTKDKVMADDKEMKDYLKSFRDIAKELILKAAEQINLTLSEVEEQLRERVYPQAVIITGMVKKFIEKYSEKKAGKNVMEFSDIEHQCLKLFSENEEICSALKEKYEEILMDEYQDSNGLQEEIFKKISRGDNLFMVGDMKQSIYLFRRSDPMIFKEKSDTFKSEEDSLNRKITLSKNFRSRKEVLDSINVVFEKIMSEEVGDIVYNEEHWLNNGNTSYEDMNDGNCGGYKSECYLLDPGYAETEREEAEEETADAVEFEAAFIAKKIAELKRSGFKVRDQEGYRVIKNSDITILMSSYKAVADIYISALNKEGIDCFADSKGYFEKNEVRVILSLIKIIQNPYQDIPLLGVLRSPVGRFSDDELVQIRSIHEGMIYEAVKKYSEQEDELAEKCRDFVNRLKKWREYTKYMSCAKLLWTLYEETGIYAFVGALYGGAEAQANLRLLFERAKQYEDAGFKGLFNFIKYIGKLETREEEMSAAKLVGEGHDVVRIMTVHKSKGLEFPVVFLAGCGKEFYRGDTKIEIHKDFGLGLSEINTDENYTLPTVAKNTVSTENKNEGISEEERKLYVAMTRAKEKLIVTGVVSKKQKTAQAYEDLWDKILPDKDSIMRAEDARGARGFIDWIAPVARRVPDLWKYEVIGNIPLEKDIAEAEKAEVKNEITEEFSLFEYSYGDLKSVPTKISVTELKMAGDKLSIIKNEAEPDSLPEFMKSEKSISAAQRGTAIHTVMQKIIPAENMDLSYVEAGIKEMIENGEISEEEGLAVDADKILNFYRTDLGKRVLKSRRVVREAPFETEIPLSYFDEYKHSDEKILLQGVIDCYFEEEEGIVLVDYKSDYYKNPAEIREKYKKQLDWYCYAIERITKQKVKEKYIYMFYENDIAEC